MKKKRKNGLPWTGILGGAVAVLLLCAVILGGTVTYLEGQRGNQGQEKREEEETGTLQETEAGETDSGSESGTEGESGGQSESDAETGLESGGQSESDAESEAESGGRSETDAETEKESSGQSESDTETEAETETEPPLVVAIDPGHQGSWVDMSDTEPLGPGSSEMKAKASTGTQGSYSGKAEYELNLEVSLALETELKERGYEVILTRRDHDTAISNAERAQMAYEEGGDIYVRIHANGSDDPSVQGALAMVPSAENPYVGDLAADSYDLADSILSHYCQTAGFENLGIQYYDNMTGINWSRLPVMILEMGFMTNEFDDLRMADDSVQEQMVQGIADGIDEYFEEKGLKERQVSPEALARTASCLEEIKESYVDPGAEAGETWAVSLLDLDTGADGDLNGDERMEAASLVKVFIMAAVYDRVCYPATEERYVPYEESYEGELRDQITQMITVSDNAAANTILERLGQGDASAGMEIVNQFCRENGYEQTSIGRRFLEENPTGENYTSANDCRELLESICRGTCVNAEASVKMYEFLRQQTRTGKIPAGLQGTGAQTANKTGELAGEYGCYVESDIAIVESEDKNYILCVLSNDLQDVGAAQGEIAEISEAVYSSL